MNAWYKHGLRNCLLGHSLPYLNKRIFLNHFEIECNYPRFCFAIDSLCNIQDIIQARLCEDHHCKKNLKVLTLYSILALKDKAVTAEVETVRCMQPEGGHYYVNARSTQDV